MSEELRRLSDEALSDVLRGLPRTSLIMLWLSKYSDAKYFHKGASLDTAYSVRFVLGDITVFIPDDTSQPTINGEEVDFLDIPEHLQYLLRTKFIEEGRVVTW